MVGAIINCAPLIKSKGKLQPVMGLRLNSVYVMAL
jgi:hypothetical protein